MHTSQTSHSGRTPAPGNSLLGWYERIPLYLRIVVALILGVLAGWLLGDWADKLKPFYSVVLRLLGALATPLIFVAVVHALVKAEVRGSTAVRMLWLLMFNTVVA